MTSSNEGHGGPSPNSIAGLSLSIFSDILSNLTHDLVLQSHRQEKLRSRTQPADPISETTCPRCNLPQHTLQTLQTADPADKKKFCSKLPFQNTPYHDIYGNPFPTINNTSAKEKKAAAASAAAASTDPPMPGPLDTPAPVPKGKNSGIVYFKCTSCDVEKAASRYAAHLEKCLGLSGRKSSRAAMAKMNSGSSGGSPMLAPADAPASGGSGGNGGVSGGNNKLGGGSRKPSPEKKSLVPPPAIFNETEEVKALPPPITAPTIIVSGSATTTTTKKKKKKVGANVPVPIPPVVMSHEGDGEDKDREASVSQPPKDLGVAPKKRKRKAEADGTINVSAIPAASTSAPLPGSSADGEIVKPPPIKKQKVAPASGAGGEAPVPTKKSQLGKLNKNRQSPTPGALSKKPPISAPSSVAGNRAPTLPPAPPPTKPTKPKIAKSKVAAATATGQGAAGAAGPVATAGKTVPRPVKKGDGVKKAKAPGKAKVGKVSGKGIGAGKSVAGSSAGGGAVAGKGIARKGT